MPTQTEDFTDLNARWNKIHDKLKAQFGQTMKMEAILLLIGMQEVGFCGYRQYSKQEKMDFMHVGTCAILVEAGYYALEKRDEDGWPHYTLLKPLPYLDLFDQVNFMRKHIVQYFEKIYTE